MLRLKRLLFDAGIRQEDFAAACGMTRTGMGNVLNERFSISSRSRRAITHQVKENPKILAVLGKHGIGVDAIWDSVADDTFYSAKLRSKLLRNPAMVPGNPNFIEPNHEEEEMLTLKARKLFGLVATPFRNDIRDAKDIYLSEDHLFIREMMLDAARRQGFVAIHGGVGSGKSTIRKAVVNELQSEGIRIVYPVIMDKSRITPASLVDAIIMDLTTEESPKRSLEAKTRQALRLLKNRASSGAKQVLIIEEAHMLTMPAFKSLKQIYELENGYQRLIGIILIGQTELKNILDENMKPEIREVIRRVEMAEIEGLGNDLQRYLEHKFARIGKKTTDILADDAYGAISKQMAISDGRNTYSKAYPLKINNLMVRAMNAAADLGEQMVTSDVIMSL
jgi:type II secretory pathway predicted ATPase ExeA